MADTEIKPGDTVSWNWGSGNPSGTAEAVKADDLSITTHRGNEVTKTGDKSDPAVKISQGQKPLLKQAHELNIEKKGSEHDQGGSSDAAGLQKLRMEKEGEEKKKGKEKEQDKKDEKKDDKDNKKDEAGEDWTHVSKEDGGKSAENGAAEKKKKDDKKQDGKKEEKKTEKSVASSNAQANGAKKQTAEKQKAPRAPKEKKERPKKRAWTDDGEPRRSKRNKT